MNRDALLASLIGFGIGLLITGILLVGPNLIKGFPQIHLPTIAFPKKNEAPKTTPASTPAQATFSVVSPTADAVVTDSDLLVSGTAPSGSTIIVAGLNDEDVMIVKEDGKFAGKITLNEGKNDVTISNMEKGKTTAQTITVFYTKENWQ